ncbi:restriction endonuclease subunit S [Bacillus wiedmannii]|uniref:restriction endonuclease subunit S n=1 Tax=Bacillus wiedmannii TaxID=1890302 RepID=UPI000BFDDF4A|nr:restriction endonuclease subunit S [Bacillus wiedmannii]PHG81179.1 type I restriction endonuclease [Bacillus wiedmannii]
MNYKQEIPNTFCTVKLKDISDIIKTGKTPPASVRKYVEKGANFIGSKSIFDDFIDKNSFLQLNEESLTHLKNCSVEEDDILLNVTGDGITFGRNAIVTKEILPAYVSQNIAIIRLKKEIVDPKYIMYYLNMPTMKEYINNFSSGSARRAISAKNIKEFELRIPSLSHQKAISKLLGTLSSKIKINNEMNKTLEEIAQVIFKHWFGDFEFPNDDGEPYKSSGGNFVESELGMIPDCWEVRSLDQIASYQNGLAMQKFRPIKEENSLPVLKIKELNQGFTDKKSDRCRDDIKESVQVYDGDIIFSWSGTLLVKVWIGGRAGLNQHLFKVTSDEYPKWFYYYWTKFHLNKFIRIAADKATTMGHIKRNHLSESFVVIPSKAKLVELDKIMNPILNSIIKNGVEIKTLSEIRDTLLPKLMSGEIFVGNVDQEVESCLQKDN